jgi:hypothetical protein
MQMKAMSIFTLLAAVAAGQVSAETAAERKARCAAQAEIVQQAVTLRTEGKRENGTIRTITRTRKGHDTPYNEAISPLTGWVYTLSDAQLQGDVAGEFRAACEGYKP